MHSIEKHGLLQPIVLRRSFKKYGFELVAGYRRWLAAKRAGWQNIPGIVLEDINDQTLLTLRLVENLHRKDLEIYEVVNLLKQLHDEHELSYSELATRLGHSKTSIATWLKLATLPEDIVRQILDGTHLNYAPRALTVQKAYLLACSNLSEEEVRSYVKRITQGGLTGKQLSNLLQQRVQVKMPNPETVLAIWGTVKAQIHKLESYCKLRGFKTTLEESERCVSFKVCFETSGKGGRK